MWQWCGGRSVRRFGTHAKIHADGLAVTPGFIDLHTHLDAQIGWDPMLTPISWHGHSKPKFPA